MGSSFSVEISGKEIICLVRVKETYVWKIHCPYTCEFLFPIVKGGISWSQFTSDVDDIMTHTESCKQVT